jgi:hypothetical protein
MVYLTSNRAVTVCVTDGSGALTRADITPDQSRSFFGKAPWQIQASSLRDLHHPAQKRHRPHRTDRATTELMPTQDQGATSRQTARIACSVRNSSHAASARRSASDPMRM